MTSGVMGGPEQGSLCAEDSEVSAAIEAMAGSWVEAARQAARERREWLQETASLEHAAAQLASIVVSLVCGIGPTVVLPPRAPGTLDEWAIAWTRRSQAQLAAGEFPFGVSLALMAIADLETRAASVIEGFSMRDEDTEVELALPWVADYLEHVAWFRCCPLSDVERAVVDWVRRQERES